MAFAEINVVPVGTDSASFSSYVASCYQIAKDEGVKHQLTPTATILEGDLDRLLNVVRKMHQAPFREGVDRVITNITIDDRRDKPTNMEMAVETVKRETH